MKWSILSSYNCSIKTFLISIYIYRFIWIYGKSFIYDNKNTILQLISRTSIMLCLHLNKILNYFITKYGIIVEPRPKVDCSELKKQSQLYVFEI